MTTTDDTIFAKELLVRMTTPTAWRTGDRVRTRRMGPGEVLHVENATGALDGIQMVAVRLDSGPTLLSLGGELEADTHTERCRILETTGSGHDQPDGYRCGCECHGPRA